MLEAKKSVLDVTVSTVRILSTKFRNSGKIQKLALSDFKYTIHKILYVIHYTDTRTRTRCVMNTVILYEYNVNLHVTYD